MSTIAHSGTAAVSSLFNVVSSIANNVNGVASMSNDVIQVGQLKTRAWRAEVERTIESEQVFDAYLRDEEIAIKAGIRMRSIEQQLEADPKLAQLVDKVKSDLKEFREAKAKATAQNQDQS